MSNISHTQPSYHDNITHWTHMDEMKWFSSGLLALLVASNLGLGLALAVICQTFGQQQCQEGMVCPKSAPHSLHNMVTSLIGPIWRK